MNIWKLFAVWQTHTVCNDFQGKKNMYEGLERHKNRCAIRGVRMRPGINFYETSTASCMPSQFGRRLLIAACAYTLISEGPVIQSWDIFGAYLRAPNNPNLRVLMKQPPWSSGTQKAPGRSAFYVEQFPETNQQIKHGTFGEVSG